MGETCGRWIRPFGFTTVSVVVIGFLVGCGPEAELFRSHSGEADRYEEPALLELVQDENTPVEQRVVAVEELERLYTSNGEPERLIPVLTRHLNRDREDPYAGYYLFLVGRIYEEHSNASSIAEHYYRRAVKEHPDTNKNGASIHHAALDRLIRLTDGPAQRAEYLEELLERFAEGAERGELHYRLAQTWEELGAWDKSFDAYEVFLEYPDARIKGRPDAHREIERLLAYRNVPAADTHEELDDLISDITAALRHRNTSRLLSLRSPVEFFTATWNQDPDDPNSRFDFDLGVFLNRSTRLQWRSEPERDSTDREAYLRTTNWDDRISVWYFYFRRIDFPANPDLHGNWEWAGIRFGERL